VAFISGIALIAEACSMPAQLGFFGRDDRANSVNSISAQNASAFSNADLAVASAATTALLEQDGASGPWENPLTGARGTVTPLAAAYRDNGSECRDFLASYVRETAEAWMQGEACRNGFGRWEVRSFKPWRR
jgi:surface antigen